MVGFLLKTLLRNKDFQQYIKIHGRSFHFYDYWGKFVLLQSFSKSTKPRIIKFITSQLEVFCKKAVLKGTILGLWHFLASDSYLKRIKNPFILSHKNRFSF